MTVAYYKVDYLRVEVRIWFWVNRGGQVFIVFQFLPLGTFKFGQNAGSVKYKKRKMYNYYKKSTICWPFLPYFT